MKVRLIIASIVVVALASPALAASYYIVQNNKTHKCSVVTKKPSAKSKTLRYLAVPDGTPASATDALKKLHPELEIR